MSEHLEPMDIDCDGCGGDGGHDELIGQGWDGPIFRFYKCLSCNGTGTITVETFPLELEDLYDA